MGVKDNFNQAVHEVFPFYKNAKAAGPAGADYRFSAVTQQAEADSEKITPITTATVPQDSGPEYTAYEQPVIETSYITKDTKIVGTVVSMSNVDISGEIIGDVESQHGIKVSGKIEGNIKGKDVDISNATIKGNVWATQKLTVINKSILVGNVSANELEFNSRISGNINVKKDVTIQSGSYITGDISAVSISIEKGAMIKGMVTTLGETDGSGLDNSL